MALQRRATSSTTAKQAARIMTAAIVVFYTLSISVMVARAATPTDGCCATCIGKTSSKPYTYDPLVYDQCSAAKGVCCFNCDSGAAPKPTIENGDFGSDGVTPEVKAGAWIQLTWSKIARVTYESYQATQIKITTVGNASSEAKAVDNVFFICAKAPGSVVVRGWGSDPCTTVTPEFTIKIVAGSGDGTCAERTPTAPTPTSKANSNSANTADEDPNIAQCNAQRASVVEVNGKKTCVCAAEWTGAPDCAGYPWWKTAATIGGGIAAVLSIAVSVKAFMNSRKAKEAEKQERAQNDPVLGEESITIAGGPELSSRSSDSAYQPSLASAKPAMNKEYSL